MKQPGHSLQEIALAPKTGRASHAATWTLYAFTAAQCARLASNVLLAHLLMPEVFGLTALMGAILAGVQAFSDIGIVPVLVRSARGEETSFRNTAWTLGVVRGLVIWGVAAGIAIPVGYFYDPRLASLLPVAGALAFIGGLNSSSVALLRRNMMLRGATLLELGSTLIGLLVTCVLAWHSPTAWAMVGGSLTGAIFFAVGSWMLVPLYRDRFMIELESATEILGFGKWILVSTVITFLALQTDRLLLGKLLTLEQVGIYSIALSLVGMPRELIVRLASSVQYPVLARCFRETPERMEEYLARTRIPLLLLIQWVMLAIGLGAQGFFAVLYDSRYQDAALITQLLCMPIFIGSIAQTSAYALLAVGDSRGLAVTNAVRAVAIVPACLVGEHIWGMMGFICGLMFSAIAGYVVQGFYLRRHGVRVVATDFGFTALFVVLLIAPLWLTKQYGWLGFFRGVDLSLAMMGAVVLIPLGVLAGIRIRPLLARETANVPPARPD